MTNLHPHQKTLLDCISLEVREQEIRFRIGDGPGLKKLKSQGLALHPIKVTRKYYGYAEYPEIEFQLSFAAETSAFQGNSAIEFLIEGESPIRGVYLGGDDRKGAIRLFTPEFPEWVEDKDVVIKLAPDNFTSEMMAEAVKSLSGQKSLMSLFEQIHGDTSFGTKDDVAQVVGFRNEHLNESQRVAVQAMMDNEELLLLHGPPGTGKTTTLVEGILQLVEKGKSVVATAPGNAAVDHLAKNLLEAGIKILRVGNSIKVDAAVYPHTSEGRMQASKEQKSIRKLKIQAEEFRKMALQYKRRFGKEERAQRSLLLKEVKRIRAEIKELRSYFDSKLLDEAEVVLGTPIGLKNGVPENHHFDTLVMDEAGQALEPLAWVVFPMADNWVLAGDPFQLPPTVLSQEASEKGFSVSILEHGFRNCRNVYLLDTQYRMRASIAQFSSNYFYNGALKTPGSLTDVQQHLVFYDTAGTGFEEQSGTDGNSLINEGELSIVQNLFEMEGISPEKAALISPYSGQVGAAREQLKNSLRISTIDSFQGQECDVVIISLVRSNEDAIIGFLKDYRRMNVAITRAKERLYVIGDSATIGRDPFYASFLEFVEENGGYRSAWELMG